MNDDPRNKLYECEVFMDGKWVAAEKYDYVEDGKITVKITLTVDSDKIRQKESASDRNRTCTKSAQAYMVQNSKR